MKKLIILLLIVFTFSLFATELIITDYSTETKQDDNIYFLSGGVPGAYTKQTASGETFFIQKGQLNNVRLRPQVMNEQCESSRQIQAVVTATNTVNQVFKASQDNINGLNLTMESAAGTEFDDFESYANSAALQAVWVSTNAVLATLSTTRVHTGTNSMYLDLSDSTPIGTQWMRTFSTVDFTGFTGEFWMYSRKEYKDVKLKVVIEDGSANQSKADIITADKEQYFKHNFNIASLVGTADVSDVVKIGFEVADTRNDGEIYIDDIARITTSKLIAISNSRSTSIFFNFITPTWAPI